MISNQQPCKGWGIPSTSCFKSPSSRRPGYLVGPTTESTPRRASSPTTTVQQWDSGAQQSGFDRRFCRNNAISESHKLKTCFIKRCEVKCINHREYLWIITMVLDGTYHYAIVFSKINPTSWNICEIFSQQVSIWSFTVFSVRWIAKGESSRVYANIQDDHVDLKESNHISYPSCLSFKPCDFTCYAGNFSWSKCLVSDNVQIFLCELCH